jgi:hypothetical protein
MCVGSLQARQQHDLATVARPGEIERVLHRRARKPATSKLRKRHNVLYDGEWPTRASQIVNQRNHARGSQSPFHVDHDDTDVRLGQQVMPQGTCVRRCEFGVVRAKLFIQLQYAEQVALFREANPGWVHLHVCGFMCAGELPQATISIPRYSSRLDEQTSPSNCAGCFILRPCTR